MEQNCQTKELVVPVKYKITQQKKRGGGAIKRLTLSDPIEINDSIQFTGGRLKHYLNIWQRWKPPKTVLKIRIPFNQAPPLIFPSLEVLEHYQTPVSPLMTSEIQTMILNQIL